MFEENRDPDEKQDCEFFVPRYRPIETHVGDLYNAEINNEN